VQWAMCGIAAYPKCAEETLASPSNDSYVEIMEVRCLLWACYLDRRQLVDCGYPFERISNDTAVVGLLEAMTAT
jgi:hypothetical protein